MTKCSALPRAFGTLPAGSAVREKSRLALYSARGAAEAARERDGPTDFFAAFFAPRLVATRLVLEVPDVGARPLPPLAPPLDRVADFFAVARLVPDRGPDRLVAMPRELCQEHAPTPFA